jgi:hypothetical protein
MSLGFEGWFDAELVAWLELWSSLNRENSFCVDFFSSYYKFAFELKL